MADAGTSRRPQKRRAPARKNPLGGKAGKQPKAPKGPDRIPEEGFAPGGPGRKGAGGEDVPDRVTPEFRKKLAEAGLKLNKEGTRIITDAGFNASRATPEQLALIQRAYNRFGIADNGVYDPTRAAYSGKAKGLIDLSTGFYLDGSGVASDAQLEFARAKAGYDPLAEYQFQLDALGEGAYVPFYLQSPENFQRYKEAARGNYVENFSENPPPPPGGEGEQAPAPGLGTGGQSFLGGFDVMGDDDLMNLGGVVQSFLQSRQQQLVGEQVNSPTFDLDELESI